VRLYALVGRLRLFAPANVIAKADEVMQHIVETYRLPNRDFRNPEDRQREDVDVLRALSEACREDLHVEIVADWSSFAMPEQSCNLM